MFISCGQTKNSSEVDTAHAISDILQELGFDPYIAVDEQTLRGLKENIFSQLENSEYFVFVDFERERLISRGQRRWSLHLQHRGSLFSHQELALAACFDLDVLPFQEEGVKPDDGIIGFLQTNPTTFRDRTQLPKLVEEEIRKRIQDGRWDPHSVRDLN